MEKNISFKTFQNLGHDIPAAFVVFLVALPLCLGIALASGAPLFSGLIAGIVGGIFAGFLSKSPLSVSGPAAGLTAIVLSSIQELGSFSLFLTCVVMAGMIQVALGYLKAGTIGHFFPVSVLKGMLSAIGLILILKQVPHAFGYDADFEGDESFVQSDHQNTFSEILNAAEQLSPGAISISLISLLILLSWTGKRPGWGRYIPAPLIVVVVGIGINFLFGLFIPGLELKQSHLVSLPGMEGITDLPKIIVFPDLSGFMDERIYRISMLIALIASIESILSIEAIDKLDPFRRITPLNAELKAQGVANIMSGILGGLPVTSVIVRGSANVMAGARTKASAIIHSLFLLVLVMAVPGMIQLIPLACLAGILLVIGLKLNSPSLYREMYKKGTEQFLPFVITIVAILLSDMLIGIAFGLLSSVFFVLKTNFKTAVILVNDENHFLLKFTKDVSFLHKSSLRKALESIPDGSTLIIDGSKSTFMDNDIIETIDDFIKSAPTKNIEVEIRKTSGAHAPMFRRAEPMNGSTKHYTEKA